MEFTTIHTQYFNTFLKLLGMTMQY